MNSPKKSFFKIIEKARSNKTVFIFNIYEAMTQKLLCARISVISSDGESINQRYKKVDGWWYDGHGEIDLSPGEYTVKAICGFEYIGLHFKIKVKKKEKIIVNIYLVRGINMQELGWYCGENHAHYYHVPQGEDKREVKISLQEVITIAKGEGLNYLHIDALKDKNGKPILKPQKITKDFIVGWNQELPDSQWYPALWSSPPNWALSFGHMWFIGIKDDKRFDFTDKPVCFEIQQWIHSKGGIAVFTHPSGWSLGWEGNPMQPVSNLAAELPFDTVIGPTYDAIDVMTGSESVMMDEQIWFCLLNMGYKIPGTATTDVAFNQFSTDPPGAMRTYSYIGKKRFSIKAVMESIKKGKNMITTGPLLFLSIDDCMVGDTLKVNNKKRKVKITAYIFGNPNEYLTLVQLIRNGRVIKAFNVENSKKEVFKKVFFLKENQNAWYIAKCYGVKTIAYTNPIYFERQSYKKPKKAMANVKCKIYDNKNKAPLSGKIEIWDFDKKIREIEFLNGKVSFKVRPTCRVKVKIKGYKPKELSIFRDYKPLYNFIISMTPVKLADPATYMKVRNFLNNVELNFDLERS
ncbi:CehA/McbA family metallohydrolase [Candidatus Calescamantes bacterium]|nr:CehA/McbA family metallohydrolase [Candidatus Calescamantes bacterium]